MIFQMYKNKISLNAVEIENKINQRLESSGNTNKEKENIESIKEKIVHEEKEKN